MKKITLITILLFGGSLFAQIINTAPYILTVNELKTWTSDGPTASPDLISTVPLAPRFTNTETQFNPALNNNMQIAYLPDGMNNFGNYYGEQNQFNLYNFTHWAYLDKFVWFGGTASQTVQIPSSPWANAAHKNGVKIFGDIFFSPTVFGGSNATLTNFLEKDASGNFIAVPKLIAIMQYYNFDGWFINQETSTLPLIASLMHDFVRDLTTAAEANGKEVMWYDAMLLSGSVGWQNRLNTANSPFVQDDQDGNGTFETRVSSNIFINFFWNSSTLPSQSRARAATIGRSNYEVFTGVDIWPGRNQANFESGGNQFMGYLHENATTPYTSLGLFAPNCVYNSAVYTNFNNDPTDYASFYNAENHMFSGADQNPALVDASAFKGFANWVPEASAIMTMPFETNFSTGHGLKKYAQGVQTSSVSWHNMNDQDILPTWQWAFSANNVLTANWDFNDAYNLGSSLKISGNLTANNAVDLMLYKTKLLATSGTKIDLTYKCNLAPNMKLIVVFADDAAQKYEFPFDNDVNTNWVTSTVELAGFAGREIALIGMRFVSETNLTAYQMNLGNIKVYEGDLGTNIPQKSSSFVTVSYPDQKNEMVFTIDWPSTSKLKYEMYDLQGKLVRFNSINLDKRINYTLDTNNFASGTYLVKFTDKNNISETKKVIVR